MRTVEQWREFLHDIKPEHLPLSFQDWKGSRESYIEDFAQQCARWDIEVEEEVARLEALTPEEYAENFFRDRFERMRSRKRKDWTEHDEGYHIAMLECAVCLGGFATQDWLDIDGEERSEA